MGISESTRSTHSLEIQSESDPPLLREVALLQFDNFADVITCGESNLAICNSHPASSGDLQRIFYP